VHSTEPDGELRPPPDELDAELVARVAEGDIRVFESWPEINQFERLVVPHEFGLEWGLGVLHVVVSWDENGLRRRAA
jgi:hypothetical protein